MQPARLAVIGAGVMGRNHARVISELPETELASVVDALPKAAEAVAQAHGSRAMSLDEVIAASDIDACVVATPTRSHRAIATALLRAGKHVLVEKPLATDAEEGRAIIDAARDADRVLAVGHIERHNPAIAYVKGALARGTYGQIIHLAARRVSRMPHRVTDVGCLLDMGVHDIDAITYLVGSRPDKVHAVGGRFSEGKHEDHAALLMGFPSGVTAVVEVNWLTPLKVRRLALTGSEQYVELDYIEQVVRQSRGKLRDVDVDNLFQLPLELSEETVVLRRQEPLKLEILDFLQAIARRRQPLVTGEDGVGVLEIVEAALRSMRTGEAQSVSG